MRISAKTSSAIVGVVIAVAVHGYQQSAMGAPDETVQLRYVAANGSVVEIVGVCYVTEASVECWDGQGKPHLRLTEAIENSLKSGQYGSTVSLKYGKKNRFVVVRTMQPQGSSNLYIDTNRRNGSSGSSFDLRSMVDDISSNIYLDYKVLRLYFDHDATETFVEFTENVNLNARISISFKEGEEFSVNGISYVIGKPTKTQAPGFGRPATGWTASVGSHGKASRTFRYSGQAIGEDGEVIQYIDENGRPISREEHETRMRRAMPSGSPMPSYGTAGYVSVNLSDDGRSGSIVTGVDPKYIKEVRITPTWVRRIRIEGIPLDPID